MIWEKNFFSKMIEAGVDDEKSRKRETEKLKERIQLAILTLQSKIT